MQDRYGRNITKNIVDGEAMYSTDDGLVIQGVDSDDSAINSFDGQAPAWYVPEPPPEESALDKLDRLMQEIQQIKQTLNI